MFTTNTLKISFVDNGSLGLNTQKLQVELDNAIGLNKAYVTIDGKNKDNKDIIVIWMIVREYSEAKIIAQNVSDFLLVKNQSCTESSGYLIWNGDKFHLSLDGIESLH